ncbi:MAG: RNA 2',3'-cyclic phosphodiesterase [Gammaproteobacteria bacterium]|nr:RNA 2',3'-cyclic phosphodiesterase [Gammaproteobacteria bacterium]
MRTFIALSIAEPLAELLASHADYMRADDRNREIRWVAPENYHLTVEFLGDVDVAMIRPLGNELASSVEDFVLPTQRVEELSYFPFVARPRVVAALLRRNEPLLELHKRVCKAVRAAGLALRRRRFHPHITLGRVRGRRTPRLLIPPVSLGVPAEFAVLTVYESRLSPAGASYRPLFEADLLVSVS